MRIFSLEISLNSKYCKIIVLTNAQEFKIVYFQTFGNMKKMKKDRNNYKQILFQKPLVLRYLKKIIKLISIFKVYIYIYIIF